MKRYTLVLLLGLLILGTQHVLAAEPVTIQLMAVEVQRKWMERVVPEFERRHPNIKVDVVYPPGSYFDFLRTRIAVGETPDVFSSGPEPDWDPIYADLTPFLAKDPSFNLNALLPASVQSGRIRGVLKRVPVAVQPNAYFYNMDHFDEAGLSDPGQLFRQGAWNRPAFLDAVRRTSRDLNGDGNVDRFGYTTNYAYDNWILQYLFMFGAGLYDAIGNITFDAPGAIAAFTHVRSLYEEHNVAKNGHPGRTLQDFSSSGGIHFLDVTTTLYGGDYTKDIGFRLGVTAPYSAMEMGPSRAVLLNWYYSMPSTTRHPEEAWEFIKFVVGPESQSIVAELASVLPVLVSEMPSAARGFEATLDVDPNILLDIMNRSELQAITLYPGYDRCVAGGVCRLMTTASQQVAQGNAPAESAVRSAAAQMRPIHEAANR